MEMNTAYIALSRETYKSSLKNRMKNTVDAYPGVEVEILITVFSVSTSG